MKIIPCLIAGLLLTQSVFAETPEQIFLPITNPFASSPAVNWGKISKPYPTNAWFHNLAVKRDGDQEVGSQPIYPLPYALKSESNGMAFGLPKEQYGYSEGLLSSLIYPFTYQLQLGQTNDSNKRIITYVSDLSVTLRWLQDDEHYIEAPIVRGAPYVTMFYHNIVPQISTAFKIFSVNGQPISEAKMIMSQRFEVTLMKDNSIPQTWVIYTQYPITFNSSTDKLIATQSYNGWIRAALLSDAELGVNNDPALLDSYKDAVPTGGSIEYKYNDASVDIVFKWQTDNHQSPLMMSLPHHRQILKNNSILNRIKMKNIKGTMLGITGNEWVLTEPLPKIKFLEVEDVNALTAEEKNQILKALNDDVPRVLALLNNNSDVYFSGKHFANAARLALIADALGQKDHAIQLVKAIEGHLTTWIQGNGVPLGYDTTWGGIIPRVNDVFGSQHYNDHHFHYGYYIYTFAVVSKLDNKLNLNWLNQSINAPTGRSIKPHDWAQMLIRDYANRDKNDEFFSYLRYQDPFLGHSWASGLMAMTDGLNEESTSEAANAYYAIALLGQQTGDNNLLEWGQLLLARELRSAHTYWQIPKDSDVYDAGFVKNLHLVANLWSNKVDIHTWFDKGGKYTREYTYGIQMLPFTAITPLLLASPWINEINSILVEITNDKNLEPSWKWILMKGRMLSNPDSYQDIWNELLQSDYASYDDGDSKTNTLYVVAAYRALNRLGT